jgi:uncharacterized membrane protein YqjE
MLSALVAAAAVWPILLLGIAAPKIAVWVLAFVPLPGWVPSWTVRVVWITLAVLVPFAVGITLAAYRRNAAALRESRLARLWHGVPVTIGVAASFLVVFVTVPVLRLMSMARRRIDVHVPLATDAASYDAVAARIEQTLNEYGFEVRRLPAPWWMTLPSSILLRLGGPSFREYVPEHLAYVQGNSLEAALYPNGLLLRGAEQETAWAHGVVLESLTAAPAYQTFDPGAQDIERQIRSVWAVYRQAPRAHQHSAILLERLNEIARDIRQLPVAYDEWQIVYRQALQLARALRGDPQLLEGASSGVPRQTETNSVEVSMGSTTTNDGRSTQALSVGELIRGITDKSTLLLKMEAELARAEIKADLKSELTMAKGMAIAAVAALMGLNLLLVALVFALTAWMPGWLAALAVAVVMLLIGAVVGYLGWRRRVTSPLALTRKTLKEDVQWAKERLA